jgi:hypothetical protein
MNEEAGRPGKKDVNKGEGQEEAALSGPAELDKERLRGHAKC